MRYNVVDATYICLKWFPPRSSPPFLSPTSFSWAPILRPHILDGIHAQIIHPFTHEDPPEVISHADRPRRDTPVADFEAHCMGGSDLTADFLELGLGER